MGNENEGLVLSSEQVSDIKQTLNSLEHQKDAGKEIKALLKGLIDSAGSDKQHIVRSMVFPEVYTQSGIALLHYFSRIVQLTHPDIDMEISVTQEGEGVTLSIEVAESDYKTVDEALENYGLALKGSMPLNAILSDPNHLMEWKQKLDLSALEVKITRDLMESPDTPHSQDIEALAEDAKTLHNLVGDGVSGLNALSVVIGSILEEDRHQINDALLLIQRKLSVKLTEEDEEEVKEALETILKHEPEIFEQIHDVVSGKTVSGGAADSLMSWIATLSGVMPR